jgi:transcriptional regulator with XRE-family HTH domain
MNEKKNDTNGKEKKKASDYVKMSNNLNAFLEERNMTADELAKKTGLTAASISLFRNMKGNVSLGNIYKIMKVLNVSLGELFGEIPINYKNILNIRYVEDINLYKNYNEVLETKNYKNYSIDNTLLDIICGVKKPADIIITKLGNNSMYSTIGASDLVIVDTSQKNIDRNGLYLVIEQNLLEIRRITIDEKRREIDITVDNKSYLGGSLRHLTEKELEGSIEGKVLKIIKKDNI